MIDFVPEDGFFQRAILMIPQKDYDRVRRSLQECLDPHINEVSVRIGNDIHYKGTNVIVTSPIFEGLLAEQRFHHVVRAIPNEIYEKFFRTGVVWFELAPGEIGRDLMNMPRASDVLDDEPAIRKQLDKLGFFKKFQERIGPDPERASVIRFEITRKVLAEAKLSEEDITRACLFMILHGAYCDAHVLTDVLPQLSSDHAA